MCLLRQVAQCLLQINDPVRHSAQEDGRRCVEHIVDDAKILRQRILTFSLFMNLTKFHRTGWCHSCSYRFLFDDALASPRLGGGVA
jgi:hypothetical protein